MSVESEIVYKHDLKNIHLEHQLTTSINEIIKRDFPSTSVIKMNVELINMICNQIEEIVKANSLQNINKLELFFRIYQSMFSLDGNEKKHVEQIINYLDNHKKIKAIYCEIKISSPRVQDLPC